MNRTINSIYMNIILNPEEAQRLDYEHNWKDLVTFDNYLSIKAQQAVFESNEKGYQHPHKTNLYEYTRTNEPAS